MQPIHLDGPRVALRPGRLLVAAASLVDPNFARTLVLLIEINEEGALGVVLNRPSQIAISEALPSATVPAPEVLFEGGPVGLDNLLGIAYADGVPALVDLDAPEGHYRVFMGYSGWGAEQLQEELAEGSWYVVRGLESDLLTDQPEELWRTVLSRQSGTIRWLATLPEDPEVN